jgi:hypothetical protein
MSGCIYPPPLPHLPHRVLLIGIGPRDEESWDSLYLPCSLWLKIRLRIRYACWSLVSFFLFPHSVAVAKKMYHLILLCSDTN